MFPWNVTVTIKPSEGSLAAVTDLIVIARRSAAVSPGRMDDRVLGLGHDSRPRRDANHGGADRDHCQTQRKETSPLEHQYLQLALHALPTDQSASATPKFQPRTTHRRTTRCYWSRASANRCKLRDGTFSSDRRGICSWRQTTLLLPRGFVADRVRGCGCP